MFPIQISQAELTEIYSTLSYITGNEVPIINLYQPAVVIYMNKKFVFPTDPGYWNGLATYELHGLRPLFVFKWLSMRASLDETKQVFTTRFNITIISEMGEPLEKARVCIIDIHDKENLAIAETDEKGIVSFDLSLRSGTSYSVQVEWTSKYGTKATGTASITETETSISLPIYDVTLRLLTPRGAPLVGVPVKVAGVDVGATDATGSVLVPQIPPGSYSVAASWLETALSLPSLVVSAPGPVTLTPTNLHVLTVRVIGAQGQALEGATVRVTRTVDTKTVEVTRLTDKDGKAQIELPDASYNIEVTYGQFSKTDSVTMTADTLKTFNLDVFIEFLGVGMSMAQFLLFIVIFIFLIGLSGTMFMKKRKTAGKARKKIKEEIEKYEKYLERLEELRKANKVSLQAYEKLKSEYESKIEELKKENTKTT
ncbi:MAG: hypothetical protein QW506_07780 [Thermoproteota archaeon]